MCSRYYISDEMEEEIRRILMQLDGKGCAWDELRTGTTSVYDVHPADDAPVLFRSGRGSLDLQFMKWGFPIFDGKGLSINARAETAREKKIFGDSVQKRRCAIPAAGFYEWDRDKNKATFYRDNGQLVWLAGFFNLIGNARHFIILTTEANDSMRPVHDRMPLILEPEQIEAWICNDERVDEFFMMQMPPLERYQEYEQMSFMC